MNLKPLPKLLSVFLLVTLIILPGKMGLGQIQPVTKLTYSSTVDTSTVGSQGVPASIATYENGDYIASFPSESKIVKFSKLGVKLFEFGTYGSTDGTFQHPWGVTVDRVGAIYVTDFMTSRLQKFTADGTFLWSVNTGNHPRGLAVDVSGNIYIACEGIHCIEKYDATGQLILTFGNSGPAESMLMHPISVAITAEGGIVVASPSTYRIVRYKNDGTFVWSRATQGPFVWGVTTSWNGNIYASTVSVPSPLFSSQPHTSRIEVFSATGTPIETYESADGSGKFDVPCGLSCSPDGSLVIADWGKHQIVRYVRSKGKIVLWGPDNSQGQLNPPVGFDFIEFALGQNHGVALRCDGTVVCWGRNSEGQCDVPQNLVDVVQVWAVWNASFALQSSGKVVSWGTTAYSQPPGGPPDNDLGLTRSICGAFYWQTCIRADGKWSRWFYQDGVSYYGDDVRPVVSSDGPYIQVYSGGWQTIGLLPNGTAKNVSFHQWGNSIGQANVEAFVGIEQILPGHSSTILRILGGQVVGIGNNGDGRLNGLETVQGVMELASGLGAGPPVIGITKELHVLRQNVSYSWPSVPLDTYPCIMLFSGGFSGALIRPIEPAPPTSTFSPSPTTTWSNTDIAATITSIDNTGGSGVKEIHYSINMESEQIVASSIASFTLTDNGTHSISYFAVDNAGNTEIAKLATVKIDKIAPVTTLSQNAGLITLSATDAHSGVAKIKYQINGGVVADYSAPFADSVHKVTYWAEDAAGNVESAKTDIINAGVQSVTVSLPQVTGGIGVIGTVTLDKAAGVGGTVVNLASSLPSIAVVDPTVTVPEGATTATFDIDAMPVSTATSVSITASIYETIQSALVNVLAPMPSSIIWSVSPVPGGTSTSGTLSISGPAPTGGTTVSLASSSLSAIVGSSVTIPAGAMTASFTVSTNAVSNDTSAVISATVYGAKLKSTLSILGPKVTSVTLASASIASTTTTTGTVTLSTNAPVGGKVVSLSSSNAAVASVPVSVTVPAGTNTVSFTITAGTVIANTNATITATTNGSTGTATITVTPPAAALSTLTTNVAAVTGGVAVTGTVTLTSAAPTGGAVVTLSSSSTTIGTVPASVTVAAGATSATFTFTTRTVTAASSLTITGSRNGVSRTATITVNPVRVVSTLVLNPTSVKGGTNSIGTVTLSGVATEAVVVTLNSGTTTVARVPTSVTVPAGSTTATFTITTLAQTATRTSVITAATGTTTRTATLSVTR